MSAGGVTVQVKTLAIAAERRSAERPGRSLGSGTALYRSSYHATCAADVTFSDPEEVVTGHAAWDAKAKRLLGLVAK